MGETILQEVIWHLFIGVAKKCVRTARFEETPNMKVHRKSISEDQYMQAMKYQMMEALAILFKSDIEKNLRKYEIKNKIFYEFRMVVMTEKELKDYVGDIIKATAKELEKGLPVDRIEGGIID